MSKNLVLGNITIKDETLARIYGLDEAGIKALKEKLKRFHKRGYELKDFEEYTKEDIKFIRKIAKKHHKTVQEILDEGERICGNKVTGIREGLLNKVPDKNDFDEIITAICNTEGVNRYHIVYIYKRLLENNTGNIVYVTFNPIGNNLEHFLTDEVDESKNEAYINLVLKEFIEACSKVTNYKPWMKSIVNRYGNISAEDKAIKTYNRLFNSMLSGWCFGCRCFYFCDEDPKIIRKYGIKEKRLLNKEIIETINCLDEE